MRKLSNNIKKIFSYRYCSRYSTWSMVPKIRDADKFKISDLSQKLKEVSDKCRNLKIDKKNFKVFNNYH